MPGVYLRLYPQVIMACGYAGDDHGVASAALGPRAIAIVTVVITDLAAEIPRLTGVLVDQRIVQIDPRVVYACGRCDLYVGGTASLLETVSVESRFATW